MKTTLDYLQAVTNTDPEKIKNDNQLAIRIGVTRQAISQYRKGQSMSVGVALKVAALLRIDATGPVLSTMYHQAGTEEEQAFWLECYQRWVTE
jgi:predicted transcriptional regulator